MSATTPLITHSNSEDSQTKRTKGGKDRRSRSKTHIARSEEANDSAQGKRKRTQNACTTCRQQKLRCDGSIKFPAPCSRCANHGLPCRVDPTFKRTPAKQRLEQVSRQLEHMREKLELRSAQPVAEEPLNLEEKPKFEDHTAPAPIFPLVERSLLPKKIGDIEISPDAIVALFHEFYSGYHSHMPIVNTTVNLENIFVESPLLFNTILFIACRHHPIYFGLYKQLISPLNALLSGFSLNPNNPDLNKNLQALLLLCSWPPPFRKQFEDGSWLRCGMASHLALQNGFHRPGYAQEFRSIKLTGEELRDRAVTWVACFVADFSLSSKLGIPASVAPDFTIRNPPSGLPEKLRQHLQIALACSKFISALSSNRSSVIGLVDTGSRWALVQLFDGELEALRTQLAQATSGPLPAESEIMLLTNLLHLHTFVLHEDIQNVVGALETSGMMIKSFRTAIKLIDAISKEQEKDLLKFYPTHVVRSLIMAALWLLKLMAVSDSRKSARTLENMTEPYCATTATALLDAKSVETAENHVREAFTILLKFSITEGDESQRASHYIDIIGGTRGDGKFSSSAWGHSIKIKGRMASSFFYDAILELKRRERERLVSAESTPREDTSVSTGRDQRKDVHDEVIPSTAGPADTWNHVEPDATPINQDLWGMLGDFDGFGSWDFLWDNGFGFVAPLDS